MEIVQRQWGKYYVLDSGDNYKVKRLVINPNKSISMQRHFKRDELWQVVSGYGIMKVSGTSEHIHPQDIFHISREEWHKVTNTSDKNQLVIIEIQTGICEEDDIERK
jgi:mannose-6-phosphate isomerase-like protein (cupin superfamily)